MSSWFRFISQPIAQALVFLAQSIGSAGLAIVVITLIIKFLLVPLTFQQLKSAKAMQELQPKIKELQGKYKADKQRLTEETMALYKEHKVNPAAGCLPLLIQLPILYGLYGALLALGNTCATKVGTTCTPDVLFNPMFAQPFLWLSGHQVVGSAVLTGLAAADPWHILPIACVVAQWIQQRMMLTTQKSADPQQAMMQNLTQFMPLLVGFFAWNYASGMALYWAISTIFSIVQQYFITGWGSLFQRPSFASMSGLGAMLGGTRAGQSGPSRNGSSRTGPSRNGPGRDGAGRDGRAAQRPAAQQERPKLAGPPAKPKRKRAG